MMLCTASQGKTAFIPQHDLAIIRNLRAHVRMALRSFKKLPKHHET